MPTEFQVKGGRNHKAELFNIKEDDARTLLLNIKTQITGTNGIKGGVLKLVNLDDPNHNISLKRKNILTRMWQRDGADMATTADTLKSLFKQAGFSEKICADLSVYLDRRSNRAGTKTISALIENGFKDIKAVSDQTPDKALLKLGVRLSNSDNNSQMAGGRGKVNTINRLAETRLYKTLNNPIELKLDGIKPNGEPKLRRGNGVGSAYLENKVPGIVRPEIYVIKEIRSDGSDAFHAVTGDKNYKNWAANFLSKNPNSKLFLGAIVMPRASGHELMTIRPDKTIYVAPVDPKILFGAARNGLGTLKDMSSGGFVHGDLKGPNIFIDENTKTLQFIDVDEITKMRKNQNTGCTVSKTPAYSHPNTMIGKIGFEQDLMGLGVTTLYTAFNSRGGASGAVPADKSRANELLSAIDTYNGEFQSLEKNIPNSAKNSDPNFLNLRSKIEALLPPHPSPVEIMALNWIQAALDQKTPLTTRYGSDGSVQHLLDRMDPEINPDIARRLDLRTNAGAQPQPQRQAQPDQQPRQPAAAIRGGAAAAVDNKADVKQLNPNALRNGIQDGLNDIYGIMDDMFKKEELPRKLGDKVYGLVDDWANSKQGRDTIELAVKDQMAESVEKGNIRIKDLLIDRFNLEHFRMTLNEDATLKDLSAENRTKLENKVINSKATYEKTEIYTLDMLANRIQRQRIILKL